MDKPNENQDGSKKRKRDEDEDVSDRLAEGVIKRHRDKEGDQGPSSAARPSCIPIQSSSSVDIVTPGCSYNWRVPHPSPEDEETNVESVISKMDWEQEERDEMKVKEGSGGADSGRHLDDNLSN